MSDDLIRGEAVLGATSSVYKIGGTVQGFLASKEFAQIGATVKKIAQISGGFSRSKELMAIGKAVQGLQFTVAKSLLDRDSQLSRTLDAVGQFTAALHRVTAEPNSALTRFLETSEELAVAYNSGVPKLLYKFVNDNSDMVELIRSGRINFDEAVNGFEEAAATASDGEFSQALSNDEVNSKARNEVVSALLNTGSLKGVSSPGLKLFIATMILLSFSLTLMNQSFDLQKNLAGLFAKVDTAAEARSKARHIPEGVSREQLSGFRVLTGDRVHLRDGPGKRHLAIEMLPMGSLLQVLDSSGKAWILVSVVVDGELLEGWVLRRYTKRIR